MAATNNLYYKTLQSLIKIGLITRFLVILMPRNHRPYEDSGIDHHCSGLMECPTTVFPFDRRQHAHFSLKQILASSCLHIEHMHSCVAVSVIILFCCLDFASTYNHSATRGMPIIKKTIMVRMGILSTNSEIPKHSVPIPSIDIQRVVLSILSPCVYITVLFLKNFCK